MGVEKPGTVHYVKCICIALMISFGLADYFAMKAMEMHDKVERQEYERRKSNWVNEDFQSIFRMREQGFFQAAFPEAERSCQEKGYTASCLLRGLLALEPGEAQNDPDKDRSIAEEYFQKGCAGEEFPVCRIIAETRRADGPRDPKDEERIITGILMTGCDLSSDLACGEAAMRLFEAGNYKMARSYGTKGCAMRDPRGNPFMNPRSCEYRKLAQEKLAQDATPPKDTTSSEDPAASKEAHPDTAAEQQ